jgi:hypothetical protein
VLEATRSFRDPTGRVVIEEKDDRDSPFPLLTPGALDVRGIAAFSELVRLSTERARKGHLTLSGQVATSGAFTGQFACMEIHVIGYVASTPTILLSSALGAGGLLSFSWDEPESYSALGIEAQQIVDGAPSGDATGIDVLSFAVAGTYWR